MDRPAPRVVEAILSVMPIDTFEPGAVRTMQVVGDPEALPDVVAEAKRFLNAEGATIEGLERFAFYEAAKRAFAVVQTSERRLYGNFIIRKGVVPPEA